jgi:hypothetical protein
MKTVNIVKEDMILYILNLIRYDIPILMAGKSSIGKSYTVLELTKQWGMPNAVLYVGSEKADNIEGLPKLIQSEQDSKAAENVLEYFKPYWFPKSDLIQKAVKSGQEIFDTKIMPNFSEATSQVLPYETLMGLLFAIGNMSFKGDSIKQSFSFVDTTKYITPDAKSFLTKDIELSRELIPKGEDALLFKNELYELSIYLCTLVGLGNYWLILDELDKVQEEEADKFAPMLHIVRERRLKNYSLRELNNGAGADVAMNVVSNSYTPIYQMIKNSLKNNQSVLDTRIIAVSNKTDNIINISDALFKRFVQVVISEILVYKPVSERLEKIKSCLMPIATNIDNEQGALTLGYLQEINLQWQFGFLPRILNNQDSGNFIRNDYMKRVAPAMSITNQDDRVVAVERLSKQSALYKLCLDNFDSDIEVNMNPDSDTEVISNVPDLVLECLGGQLMTFSKEEKGVAESSPLDIIAEIRSKGFSARDAALEIGNLLDLKYEKIPENESRRMELESLIRFAFSFIDLSVMNNDDSSFSVTEELPFIIPVAERFILKVLSKDAIIGVDDKGVLASLHSQLWTDFVARGFSLDIIKADEELTKRLFYGGEDSLWGSSDLDADAFQKSFINSYNTANAELFEDFIMTYLDMDAAEQKKFDGFIEYIKKYRIDEVAEIKKRAQRSLIVNKKMNESLALGKKFNTAFGLK